MTGNGSLQNEIRAQLLGLLVDAIGDDRVVTRQELRSVGIPERWRESIARASKRVVTRDDAADVASEYAADIAATFEDDEMDPRALADRVRPLVPRS